MIKNKRIPLYLQLMDQIIDKINTQEYREQEKLPSEREFCDLYGMSRITVRQALQELEREGYIYKLHGKGTFVAPKSYSQNLVKLYSFTDEMRKIGKVPTSKVLSFEAVKAEESIGNKMGINPTEEVYKVVRLRLADGEPLMYETSYIPVSKFPGLTQELLEKKPMYEVFYDDYTVPVNKAVESFSPTLVREEEAKYLQIPSKQTAMLIKRYAYSNEQLIEYTITVARGDKFEYKVELT
ncbi:GntR family transcriptional regulator [Virgibacillus senegalensis]|uniref:GntR family transcriptional regulator n=1 Tax=Virgibacillus senegalensis TaxID=1499679 RepID=UPI000ABF4BF5|nr:GntR family transcriptional regulator [Virgibacillus senegalensis]